MRLECNDRLHLLVIDQCTDPQNKNNKIEEMFYPKNLSHPVQFSGFKYEKEQSVDNLKIDIFQSKPRKDLSDKQKLQGRIQRDEPLIPVIKTMPVKFFTFLDHLTDKLMSINYPPDQIETKITEVLDESRKRLKNNGKRMSSEGGEKKKRHSIRNSTRQTHQLLEGSQIDPKKLNGDVNFSVISGEMFTGYAEKGEIKRGKIIFPSGLEYDGTFENNLFHGNSTLTLPDATVIQLKWFQGYPNDTAKIRYPNQDQYVGGIKDFKKNGAGILRFNDGKKYIGQFHEGNIKGKGTYYNEKGQIKARGIWLKGKLIKGQIQENQIKTQSSSFLTISTA